MWEGGGQPMACLCLQNRSATLVGQWFFLPPSLFCFCYCNAIAIMFPSGRPELPLWPPVRGFYGSWNTLETTPLWFARTNEVEDSMTDHRNPFSMTSVRGFKHLQGLPESWGWKGPQAGMLTVLNQLLSNLGFKGSRDEVPRTPRNCLLHCWRALTVKKCYGRFWVCKAVVDIV